MSNIVSELRSFIERKLIEGFESEQDIIQNAGDYALEKYNRDDMQSAIQQMTAEAFIAYKTQQSSWVRPTDCDRLDQAFSSLERLGIVARQHFTCCLNCGHTEIWDDIEHTELIHPVEGYVFYHHQCTEMAIDSRILYLAYGSVEEDEASLKKIVDITVQELNKAGLNATLGGELGESPIIIAEIDWKRYREE